MKQYSVNSKRRVRLGNTPFILTKTCIVIHTLISFVEEGDEDNEYMDELVREGADAPGDVMGQADGGPI